MATGAHKYMKIKGSDVVVFSSNPIPGNEKNVVRTVDGLMREGSDVIQNGKTHLTGIGPLHLSGHGYYDDHIKLINALNPTYYMPIHGEFHMLVYNARLAEKECGIPRKNIFVCDAGDIIEIDIERQAKKAGRIQVGGVMYDDTGAIVSEVVLKDRMMNMIRQYLKQKAARSFAGKYDLDVVKKEIKDEVTHILYDQTHRTPIVIPVINEVGGLKTVKSTATSNTSTIKTPARSKKSAAASAEEPKMTLPTMPRRRFPRRQVPDTEANDTKAREVGRVRAY